MACKPSAQTLVLASSSPYRAQALRQLGLVFEVAKPKTDETPLRGESPGELVRRLAECKARSVAEGFSNAVIIGSDQVGCCDGRLLQKPGTSADAITQLYTARGKNARFYTALTVLEQRNNRYHSEVVTTDMVFRKFSMSEVERYVHLDKPLDCAGSFKIEALGIALFSSVSSDDPSALIGIPLIALVSLLGKCGINPLQNL